MLAAYGLGWFNTMQACAETFIALGETYKPNIENHKKYKQYFEIYKNIYAQTKTITENLLNIN